MRWSHIRFFISVFLLIAVVSCNESDYPPKQASTLYFADYNGKKVGSMEINTPDELKTLADVNTDALGLPSSIAVGTKHGKIYIADESKSRILRKKLDGTGSSEVIYDGSDGVDTPTALALDVDGGKIYWNNGGTGSIMRGSLDGTAAPIALFGGSQVFYEAYGLQVDVKNNRLYIAAAEQGILVGNLDGTGTMSTLYPGKASTNLPINLALDISGEKIYWTDVVAKTISVAPVNGLSDPEILWQGDDGLMFPIGIAIDKVAKRIYWSDSNGIVYGNMDGTGSPTVLVFGVNAFMLCLNR